MNSNWTYAIIILIAILIALGGGYYMGLKQGHKTNSGTTSNTASTSAQIPTETIRYERVYIPVPGLGGVAAASKAIIPIVPASVTSQIRDEFVSVDMQCIASGSVDATIYNNQVYNASGTTYLLQTASYTARGQVIKPMSWWDYLVQYGGWAALTLFVIFKG